MMSETHTYRLRCVTLCCIVLCCIALCFMFYVLGCMIYLYHISVFKNIGYVNERCAFFLCGTTPKYPCLFVIKSSPDNIKVFVSLFTNSWVEPSVLWPLKFPFWQKEMPQSFFSVFSSLVAPI